MTQRAPDPARARTIATAVLHSPILLWAAFILVHLWLGLVNLYSSTGPMGDVTGVYRFWMDQGFEAGTWVGIDTAWVYPVLALVPMIVARAFGPELYGSTWLSMILVLDAVAFGFLTGWGRSRERIAVAWWWVAFLLALGPIALGRIDAVTVAFALVGVVLIATRPRVAAVLLAIAMWVKVWPAALIVAALIALRARVQVFTTVLAFSAATIVVSLLLGSGSNVLGFITEQTGRGLQVESPVTTIWLWRSLAGVPMTFIYFDQQILTYQVEGAGVDVAAAVMTPILAIAVLAVVALGIRAARAGASAGDLLPPLALAVITALIAFNKVGSPQFISWLAVPVVLGLATSAAGHGRSFRFPAAIVLVMALLTQLIYPFLYDELLMLNPLVLGMLTVRNVFEFVLLGWAVVAVIRSPSEPGDDDEQWLPSVWPFAAVPDAERDLARS